MPTIEEIQKEYPNLKFVKEFSKDLNYDVFTILKDNKAVDMRFDFEHYNMNEFNDRILNPCIYAIEMKVKNNA